MVTKFIVWFRSKGKPCYRTIVASTKAEAMSKLRAKGKTPLTAEKK